MSPPAAVLAGGLTLRVRCMLPGLRLAAALAAVALGLSRLPLISASGLGVMTLAIVLTMAMATIVLHTRLDALRQGGAGPLRLAGALSCSWCWGAG